MERSSSVPLLLALLANIALCIYFAASVDVEYEPPSSPFQHCVDDCREPITG
jgi:hypothetical protein